MCEIVDVVNDIYSDKPEETRAVIAAVAYMMYSLRKKQSVNSIIETGKLKFPEDSSLGALIAGARNVIESDCSEACALFQHLEIAGANAALTLVNNSLEALPQNINPILNEIRSLQVSMCEMKGSVKGVECYVNDLKAEDVQKKRDWKIILFKNTLRFVLVDSLKHLILLFIAIVGWAFAILYAIDHLMPGVRRGVSSIAADEFRALVPADSAKEPPERNQGH